jgi:GNAT superfamily N-acetyltransferase
LFVSTRESSRSHTDGCSSIRCRSAREPDRLRPGLYRREDEYEERAVSVEYALEPALTACDFIDLLRRSTLAERRPVDNATTIAGMLSKADIILTARNEMGILLGVSRAISDFHYCTYLSDLAVDVAHQRQGIGRNLIRRTHEAAGLGTRLILLSAPAARTYYSHIGMRPHDSCWTIDPVPNVAPAADSDR